MKNKLEFVLLTQDELTVIGGGGITTGTPFGWDVGYILGLMARSYYEFVTVAASFQSSLPANLKK